jgi:transcriptional regulator with XRE-family HTH domain
LYGSSINSFDTESINQLMAESIPKVSIRQVKAARVLLGWTQGKLAEVSGISIPTIKRLEASEGLLGGRNDTASSIRAALEKAGIEFIDENGGGSGVRLRHAPPKTPKDRSRT